ncbi:hypothetical protein DW806_14520 [Butyricicoccus sp. AM32-19]|nr:hypothetical protein DW806_14520 [Butyricicoccus sp. AM32-19]RHV78318.1 hypothetical protein DXB00_15610 [Butyricicoccus sp. OF10-2]
MKLLYALSLSKKYYFNFYASCGSTHLIEFQSKFIKIGGVYLGFYTLRGRKFPNGNFRTSVFCEVKTQIVGKTKFFDSLRAYSLKLLYALFMVLQSI